MHFEPSPTHDLRAGIRALAYAGEADLVMRLLGEIRLDASARAAVTARAAALVTDVRDRASPSVMEAFLAEYGLSTDEGVGLMCLAEALLRVPDAETIDDLIADKIEPSNWGAHLGKSSSSLVNAATWGLLLTGRVLDDDPARPVAALRDVLRRLGEPVVRGAVAQAMKLMGRNFVLGETIGAAMERARLLEARGYTYSYDMLGEGARTHADAERYAAAYATAIAAIAARATGDVRRSPGISVKLSALHPRYEWTHRAEVMETLVPRVLTLARAAARARIGFNIDAEEADRLDLSLDVIEAMLVDPDLIGWDGFGIVVQAYGRRAGAVIDCIHTLASRLDRRIMVRLVKGAYWDTEIKQAQELGLPDFPVFTRKPNTDVSYIACARKLLDRRDRIYPQFATHNAHTVAAVLAMAGDRTGFEFQRLHGMGEALHEIIHARDQVGCRIYAPVGAHRDLLAYLVRRLLENGANSSFVNQIVDTSLAPEDIAADPMAEVERLCEALPNPDITPPAALFAPRRNAAGWNPNEPASIADLIAARENWRTHRWQAGPTLQDPDAALPPQPVLNPADPSDTVGEVRTASPAQIAAALAEAHAAFPAWSATPPATRAAILRDAADLYEASAAELTALATREAGKTLADAIAELREAVDFLRYYATEAEAATGTGRGVMIAISPWNFPLAIFTGQVAAFLGAGNAVIAKPAEQTPLIAARATALLHVAGVPHGALVLLPGDGPGVGGPLTAAPDIAGVCFTGSTDVAQTIHRTMADRASPEAVLIAETGGINAMIVDSTALTEQVVRDVIASAFQSAGQRCSSLRMLYVQTEARPRVLEMLHGALEALTLGNPWDPATDIGPLIDADALSDVSSYVAGNSAKVLKCIDTPSTGFFASPTVLAVDGIMDLDREVFGPVLHVASFKPRDLDRVIGHINARGYGLTFGLHTRIDGRVERVTSRIRAGNVYVNRNQIGAIVGSQPFGGEGLSGTGPKAGGAHYLPRLQRRPEAAAEAHPSGPVHAIAKPFTQPDAGLWAARRDRIAALRAAVGDHPALDPCARHLHGPLDLPGPTGESNRLGFHPRGRVLVLGAGAPDVLAQSLQALAAGNAVLAVAPEASSALAALSAFPLLTLDGRIDPAELETLPDLALVAARGPQDWLRTLWRALAARPGPIVPLETALLAPERYVIERHLCIDTTAAGGNASLLAAST